MRIIYGLVIILLLLQTSSMNMIYNQAIEVNSKPYKKGFYKSLVESSMSSQKFIRLSQSQIQNFIEHQQIVQCAHLLEKGLSNHKLAKLYFILFQVTLSCENESFINFLSQHNFHDKVCSSKIDKLNLGQRIILNKMANFMDTFKASKDAKSRVNSLVNEYHQYRILDSFKQNSFVVGVCGIIKQYLFAIVNVLLAEVQFSQWNFMEDQAFEEFYVEYSQFCTICKRINYIKCSLLALPTFKINSSVSNLIEERHISIINSAQKHKQYIPVQVYKGLPQHNQDVQQGYGDQGKEKPKEKEKEKEKEECLQRIEQENSKSPKELKEAKKPQKQIKLAAISNFSVKKKLKAMNQLINKLQQQI